MSRHLLVPSLVCLLSFSLGVLAGEPAQSKSGLLVPEQLQTFAKWIGGWRGVAQPVRGSSRGAWSLKGDWIWDFSQGDSAELVYQAEDGRQMSQIRIAPVSSTPPASSQTAEQKPLFQVELVNQSGQKTPLQGAWKEDKFIAQTPEGATPGLQLTIRPLHNTRLLILLEQKSASRNTYQRVVEFGLTRKGVRLAERDSSGPECVVTGGEGTIAVSYQGKTYYVCCTGCKQAFDKDPAGILAAYFEQKKKPASKQ